ncbi:hypothetical protein MSAN_02291800 [Mycena sanguinolenta]|uniref:F-box domain-containing protein n=1 Tax=Mycena sanguinolenta TaxID=230812 RepID=A0A8H7CHK1_9AGAR|nr:hypothetical protein MSAN_02291800 [Mycena sanguinolenta]
MVLTRRATKALKSITRWLPAEMLLEMCGYVSDSTLASLCRTGRTMRALATPVLYRSVSLTDGRRATRFIEAVASRPALAAHVRRLLLKRDKEDVDLSRPTTQTLNRILPLMTRLEDLDLRCVDFWLEGGIGGVCFRDLRSFGGLAIPESCASMEAFLHRHSTITTLDVMGCWENEVGTSAVHLPQLAAYTGSANFLSFLDDATVRRILSLDLCALDANFGAVLSRLAPCAHLRRVAGTLVDVEAAEVMEAVRKYVPQIQHIALRAQVPTELPLAGVAERLGTLPLLRQLEFRRYTHASKAAGTVRTCGAACEALLQVVLDDQEWRRVGGQWVTWPPEGDGELGSTSCLRA